MVDAIISSELALRDSAMQLARVIGQSMQRIAQTQIEATEARLAASAPGEIDPAAAVARAEALVPVMPPIFEYVWRRHLQSAIRRRLAGDAPLLEGPPPRTVGFADMVGFTTLSQELDDTELAAVVDRFETQAQPFWLFGDHAAIVSARPCAGGRPCDRAPPDPRLACE